MRRLYPYLGLLILAAACSRGTNSSPTAGAALVVTATPTATPTPAPTPVPRPLDASGPMQLLDLWPNPSLDGDYYLHQGASNNPERAIAAFWIEHTSGRTFRASNSAPFGACNQDFYEILSDGSIGYAGTRHDCEGVEQRLDLDPPIRFFPASWDQSPWRAHGVSTGRFYERGKFVGKARYTYDNEILGWEGTGAERRIHWRTNQTFAWLAGPWVGHSTRWEENWRFGELPIDGGGVGLGLVSTMGGNHYRNWPQWNITFDRWRALSGRSGATATTLSLGGHGSTDSASADQPSLRERLAPF